MQLDMFGATEESTTQSASAPIRGSDGWVSAEALIFADLLRSKDSGACLAMLKQMKTELAAKVLLATGFALTTMKDRGEMMAFVQRDLLEAIRRGMTGYDLRESRELQGVDQVSNNVVTELQTELTEEHTNGRLGTAEAVLAGDGQRDRAAGSNGDLNREPLDVGLADAGEKTDPAGTVHAGAEGAAGARTGDGGRSGEHVAPELSRAESDVRSEGGSTSSDVAGDISSAADIQVPRLGVAEAAGIVADYVVSDEDRIGLGTLGEKFHDNLAAIRLMRDLQAAGRQATSEEQRTLARYVGWGGLKGVFDPDNKRWAKQHLVLRAVLSDEEWAAARKSQLDAFYTAMPVVKAAVGAVRQIGFNHGRILEPSVGVGNFFGVLPEDMRRKSNLHGVELDILTSQIVDALYPSAQIAKATGFQDYKVPAGYFDLVIGNPPFGGQAVVDDVGSSYSGWSIHNYFFAKSIDMLRPGGVMSMVVSHNFLDKLDPHVRQWISRRADLVSAVRLPDTAFKENAGSEIVTDILLFQKRDRLASLGKDETPLWLETTDVELDGATPGEVEKVSINNYFLANPQNVLGRHAAKGGMYRGNSYTVEATGDLQEGLDKWVASLPTDLYVPLVRNAEELEAADVAIPDGVKEGSFFVEGGRVFQRLADQMGRERSAPWIAPNQRAFERMTSMIGIREVMRAQMRLERSPLASDEAVEAGRKELNDAYNAFQRKNGFLNDAVNRRLFADDTESALVQALEFDYEKPISAAKAEEMGVEARPARATKADILSRRVLFPPVEVQNVETAKDALIHSLNMTGGVDMDYMMRAYGQDENTIRLELGDVLYDDPIKGYVTADEYLSGDVKTKLNEAKAAAKQDVRFSRNVDALESVVPKDRLPSEIFASVGAAWIPPEVYRAFALEIAGADINYKYLPVTAQWLAGTPMGTNVVKNTSEFGTTKMSALGILAATMNSRAIEVMRTEIVNGQPRSVTDEAGTEAARAKAEKIRAHWDAWIWKDPQRTEQLTKIYNERFNRTIGRTYDGAHLSFPGMNPAIKLLGHQKNGVWRALQDRTMLSDKVVGAGKTFEMVAIAMEMRRLGIAKKPLYAVPNHLTLQWRSDFYRLYPGANILAATPDDFDKENREKFFSKIVTGNWDAIIIGHSSLKKLGVPIEAEKRILDGQVNELGAAIETMKHERGDRHIIRDMEKIKQNLEAKVKKLVEKSGSRDKVVDFGDLGVDMLAIDEHHEFKNLFFTTQMNKVAGLGNPAGSGKAFDLFVKIRWLKETFGERAPLITGTGTPVSNSLAEMFTMQRYMQYEELQRNGLHHFDAWAKQYGDVQTVYEVAPSGTGYRLSQRFSKFKNLPSLMGAYRSFADVVTLDDLKEQERALGREFPVPKVKGGKPNNVVAPRSELQEKFFGIPEIVRDEAGNLRFEFDIHQPFEIEQLPEGRWGLKSTTSWLGKTFETKEEAEFALGVRATTPQMTIDRNSLIGKFENLRELTRSTKGKVNALSLTGLANKAGLDYRIIDPTAPDYEGSKINLAVKNMMDIYHAWEEDKGVQLVFCDLSVPLSAKAKMASAEKRLFVRKDDGKLTHKRGTLHTMPGYEGLPYYLVGEGKGNLRSFTMYDPVTGQVLKNGLESKREAHDFALAFVQREGGQDEWLDLREKSLPIEDDEIDEYRGSLALEEEGDSADFEFTAKDIEGVSGATEFSVYDDIKAKLMRQGVPEREIEFIHDHDTPQAKDALFKRVNAGEVRYLFGSTPKMGAGTNVQRRLVGLHHIDAPWRPSDLEQREGRIIRRGNIFYERDPQGFAVEIHRYATSQTYDTRRWQLLEHKAAGVAQLRNYSGEIEIEDVASEASNSADMKAAASGNPLILKETQLAADVKRLRSLARAHDDSEFLLNSRMRSYERYVAKEGPAAIEKLEKLQSKISASTVLLEYEGRKHTEKAGATQAMGRVGAALNELGAERHVLYKGIKFSFERPSERYVRMSMPDNNATPMDALSPTGAITRMENWCNGIPDSIAEIRTMIDDAKVKIDETRQMVGKPFADADALTAALGEHSKVQRALMRANSLAAVKPHEMAAFLTAQEAQKERLRALGMGHVVALLEANDRDSAKQQGIESGVAPKTADIPDDAVVVQSGLHVGSVLEVTEGYVKQSTGRGQVVFHEVARLTGKMPAPGDVVGIAYAGGKAMVKNEKTQEQESLLR